MGTNALTCTGAKDWFLLLWMNLHWFNLGAMYEVFVAPSWVYIWGHCAGRVPAKNE